jgi:hypothetical protein
VLETHLKDATKDDAGEVDIEICSVMLMTKGIGSIRLGM